MAIWIPTTERDLLVAALRHANTVSSLLNRISSEVFRLDEAEGGDQPKYEHLHDLVREQFDEASGVFLFISAHNMRLELPPDLMPVEEPAA